MAFDPRWEDYQRMSLRFARSLDEEDQADAAHAFTSFGRRLAQDRDSLPQSDADRAFHLVAEATALIDYKLPFATDEEAETMVSRGHAMLDEAVSLDPLCHDAIRMRAAARCPSFEAYYDFLREGAAEVRARCEEGRAAAGDGSPERARVGADLAMRPYLRWVASLAGKAVICGRNREALRHCDELLELDPSDAADARLTAAIAYAKLEDEQGLDRLGTRLGTHSQLGEATDAWTLLARLSLAYKRMDLAAAHRLMGRLVELYPYAAVTLARQRELPDGVFARLSVQPLSEDELIVAVSECTVLLQEGRDSLGRGALGSWVLREALSLATPEQLGELDDVLDALGTRVGGTAAGGDAP